MRYFQTTNASRRYVVGGFAFIFEPVSNVGGSWLGVLAVEDESAASALTQAKLPQVSEISAEEFDALKKKPQRATTWREQRPVAALAQSVPQLPVVGPVGPPVSTPSSSREAPKPVANTEIKTAVVDVPDELRLETGVKHTRSR